VKPSKVAILTEFNSNIKRMGVDFYNMVPTEYTDFIRVEIDIIDNSQKAGIKFCEELMNGGQYYISGDKKAIQIYFDQWRNRFGTMLDKAADKRKEMDMGWGEGNLTGLLKRCWIAYREYYDEA